MKAKAVIVPKHVVARLGKGDHASGAALLDGFMDHDGTPIDSWPGAEDDDYVLREQDIKALGKGSHRRGFHRDHS